jgi:hypothetical protein
VIFADPSTEKFPAVAVKLAEIEPVDIVTVAGTVNVAALLDRLTVAPPVTAAFDRVTEQAEVPAGVRLDGKQETPVTVGLATKEIEVSTELPL